MKKETIAIHAGYTTDPATKSVAVPIFQTVAYEFDNAQHGADLFDLAVPRDSLPEKHVIKMSLIGVVHTAFLLGNRLQHWPGYRFI